MSFLRELLAVVVPAAIRIGRALGVTDHVPLPGQVPEVVVVAGLVVLVIAAGLTLPSGGVRWTYWVCMAALTLWILPSVSGVAGLIADGVLLVAAGVALVAWESRRRRSGIGEHDLDWRRWMAYLVWGPNRGPEWTWDGEQWVAAPLPESPRSRSRGQARARGRRRKHPRHR